MNPIQALTAQLEAYVQEELGIQRNLLDVLRAQETALFHGELAAMQACAARVEVELQGAAARAARRSELLRRFARHFGVAQSALTLTSLCTRLGDDGAHLQELGASLREATLSVARATRRLSALARLHSRLNDEILGAVLAVQGAQNTNPQRTGALLDAQV